MSGYSTEIIIRADEDGNVEVIGPGYTEPHQIKSGEQIKFTARMDVAEHATSPPAPEEEARKRCPTCEAEMCFDGFGHRWYCPTCLVADLGADRPALPPQGEEAEEGGSEGLTQTLLARLVHLRSENCGIPTQAEMQAVVDDLIDAYDGPQTPPCPGECVEMAAARESDNYVPEFHTFRDHTLGGKTEQSTTPRSAPDPTPSSEDDAVSRDPVPDDQKVRVYNPSETPPGPTVGWPDYATARADAEANGRLFQACVDHGFVWRVPCDEEEHSDDCCEGAGWNWQFHRDVVHAMAAAEDMRAEAQEAIEVAEARAEQAEAEVREVLRGAFVRVGRIATALGKQDCFNHVLDDVQAALQSVEWGAVDEGPIVHLAALSEASVPTTGEATTTPGYHAEQGTPQGWDSGGADLVPGEIELRLFLAWEELGDLSAEDLLALVHERLPEFPGMAGSVRWAEHEPSEEGAS